MIDVNYTLYKHIKLGNTAVFKPWIWCVLLQIFISSPAIACFGLNIGVSVYPEGLVYIRHGSPLEIFCVNENNSSTADDLEFTSQNNILLHFDKVNDTSIRLFIEKPEIQLNTYYCKNRKNDKICPLRVIVEEPPQNVTDFSCLSKNLEALYCNWTSPPSKDKCNYSVTYMVNDRNVTPSIPEKSNIDNQEVWSCMWDSSTIPRYRQQLDYYVFFLQSCNYFGCNIQKIVVNHFAIVKPDPPQLEVFVTGPHSVLLKWNISNIIYLFVKGGVDFKIEYQIENIDKSNQFHLVDTSDLPSHDLSYSYELTLPYAFRNYEVRIYVKTREADEKLWSEFNYKIFKTASELPARPPNMIAGSFTQTAFMRQREIYVYWKQLEDYEVAGPNFTYKVVVTHNNDKRKTIFTDKGSFSYISTDHAESLNVKVWSHNVHGSSVNFSQLYIPPLKETQGLQLNSFTQVGYENGTYELSWDNLLHIDNYSLFWCEHMTFRICSSPISYKVLGSEINNHVIHLPSGYHYHFAISANNGTATSGMISATCDIHIATIHMYKIPVNRFGRTYVELKWSLKCVLKANIVTGYKINYCPVIEDVNLMESLCDNRVGDDNDTWVYIDDPNQFSKNITNLLPFQTYMFSIAINTSSGLQSFDNNVHIVTTLEDAPSKPRHVRINNITYNSLFISWDPPLHENGIISEYILYNLISTQETNTYRNTMYHHVTNANRKERRTLLVDGLEPYANYSVIVKACNINENPQYCSESDSISLTTTIGPPRKMNVPTISFHPDGLEWYPQITSGKPVDRYQILRIRNRNEIDIINVTNTNYVMKHCNNVNEVAYQIRGINFDYHANNDIQTIQNVTQLDEQSPPNEYPGEWSNKMIVECNNDDGITITLFNN